MKGDEAAMKLIIEGSPKEIAALAAELQERSRHIIVRGVPSTRQERGTLVATINEILSEQSAGKSSQQ